MKIYKVNWDYKHLVKNQYDLMVIDNFEKISTHGLIGSIIDVEIPKEINFKSNIVDVSHLNFPVNDLHLPIINKKVFDVFFKIVKPRKVVKINIYHNGKQIDSGDYCTFQLGTYFDCFDYENSVYESDFILPISKMIKMVIKPSDFPDIFRINLCIPDLYVNEKTKTAIESSGISDINFEAISVSEPF